jgi:hypothetical protein
MEIALFLVNPVAVLLAASTFLGFVGRNSRGLLGLFAGMSSWLFNPGGIL